MDRLLLRLYPQSLQDVKVCFRVFLAQTDAVAWCVCAVFCRVYTPDHSYVTIRSRLSCRVGEILALVKEKLQYSEDQPTQPGNLILVAVTSAGGRTHTLYTNIYTHTHTLHTHTHAYYIHTRAPQLY